jgi:ParB-like chromosome segregation protein Spo0J
MGIINGPVEMVDVNAVKVHPKNVNIGNVDAIVESIKVNGFYGNIIVNKQTKNIVAGNHRYKAVLELGWKEIPVQWINIPSDDEMRLLLVDNKVTKLGITNDKVLADVLLELLQGEGTLVGSGYDAGELDRIIAQMNTETYSPNLAPDFELKDRVVSETDVDRAEVTLADRVPEMRKTKEVMCPNCGWEYNID